MGWGGGGVHAPPFHGSYEVVVYASAERADTLPLFLLYPYMYSVVATTEYIYWFYFARPAPPPFLQQIYKTTFRKYSQHRIFVLLARSLIVARLATPPCILATVLSWE